MDWLIGDGEIKLSIEDRTENGEIKRRASVK